MQLMKVCGACVHIRAIQFPRLFQSNSGEHHAWRLELHGYRIWVPSASQFRHWSPEFHKTAETESLKNN
jgi:hypothetical protein